MKCLEGQYEHTRRTCEGGVNGRDFVSTTPSTLFAAIRFSTPLSLAVINWHCYSL
jgi:hypothetical protein